MHSACAHGQNVEPTCEAFKWAFNEETERFAKDMTIYVRGCDDLDL